MSGRHVHRYELTSFDVTREGGAPHKYTATFECMGVGSCGVRVFRLELGDPIPLILALYIEWAVTRHPSPKKGG